MPDDLSKLLGTVPNSVAKENAIGLTSLGKEPQPVKERQPQATANSESAAPPQLADPDSIAEIQTEPIQFRSRCLRNRMKKISEVFKQGQDKDRDETERPSVRDSGSTSIPLQRLEKV